MLLLIDKPKGVTSHDVVDRVRRVAHERRVGHAGTLDPNATGLLIVAVTREDTKKLGEITKATKKTYIGEITLGISTTTDDSEGEVVEEKQTNPFTREKIDSVLHTFLGDSEQVPPIYSAIKQNGKKAYEIARSGGDIVLPPRPITIYALNVISYEHPLLVVECEVSSGTYIRSLARDIGIRLGTAAHLSNLRRTKIGEYSIENAIPLDKLTEETYNSL